MKIARKISILLIMCLVLVGMSVPSIADDDVNYHSETAPSIAGIMRGIAKATVSSGGTIYNEHLVDAVEWDPTNERWLVTFPVSYHYLDHVPLITVLGTSDATATTGSISGQMTVYIWENGVKVQKGFSLALIY